MENRSTGLVPNWGDKFFIQIKISYDFLKHLVMLVFGMTIMSSFKLGVTEWPWTMWMVQSRVLFNPLTLVISCSTWMEKWECFYKSTVITQVCDRPLPPPSKLYGYPMNRWHAKYVFGPKSDDVKVEQRK